MKVWPVLFAAAPAVGFLLGISSEPEVAVQSGREARALPAPPSLVHSGRGVSIARQRLAGVGRGFFQPPLAVVQGADGQPFVVASEPLPPPMNQPPLMDVPPPPPEPIDIAGQLSRDLTAVVRGSEGPTLLLVDASTGRRSLRRGEAYLDGWKVREINGSEIVLRKDDSEQRIPIMQVPPRPTPLAPPPVQAALAAPPSEVGGGSAPAEYQIEDASVPDVAPPPQAEEVPRQRRRISRPGRE